MTTQNWNTPLDQSTDAGFRAWGSELSAKLALVGCVQQADTGQINWATVVRPASSTAAGYEIWKTPAGNLCFKLEYGALGAVNFPSIWLTVGTGSNGTGTITGQTSTRAQPASNSAAASLVTNYPSYLCAVGDYVGLSWKVNSLGTANETRTYFIIGPKVDATGSPLTTAYFVVTRSTNFQLFLQSVRTAAPAATGLNTRSFIIIPGLPATSADGLGNNQVYLHWLNSPDVNPTLFSATVFAAEITFGTTLVATLVGSTPRTYLCAAAGGDTFDALATSGLAAIMLWE